MLQYLDHYTFKVPQLSLSPSAFCCPCCVSCLQPNSYCIQYDCTHIHTQVKQSCGTQSCHVTSSPPHLLLPLYFIFLLLRLWPLSDLSECTYYCYGMSLEVGLGKHLHSNSSCCENVCGGGGGENVGMRRDCRRGRGELTIMVCSLQGNYAEWGRGD